MRLISGSLGLFNGTIFLFAESCAVHRGFFYNAVRFARLLKCSTTEWSSFSWNSGGGYAFGRSTVLSVLCGSNFDTSQDSQIYLYMEWVLGVLGSSYLAAGAQWNLVTSVDEPLELIRRSMRDVPWNPWDCLGCIFDFGILNQFRLKCWNVGIGMLEFWFWTNFDFVNLFRELQKMVPSSLRYFFSAWSRCLFAAWKFRLYSAI